MADVNKLTLLQLRERCKSLKIKCRGSKPELLDRLAKHRSENSSNQNPSEKRKDSSPVHFPVILQDLKTGVATFSALGPFTDTLFKNTVGAVSSQKRICHDKWLISCVSMKQQESLLKATDLAGVTVKCSTPQIKTMGVIKPIPHGVDLDRFTSVDGITGATRLKTKQNAPSRSVCLSFSSPILPPNIKIGNQVFVVTPFAAPVFLCTRCGRLGHTKAHCRVKAASCLRCGCGLHKDKSCEKTCCINCGGEHSALHSGCPEFKTRQLANKIRSASYMTYDDALKKARQELILESTKETPHSSSSSVGPVLVPTNGKQEPNNETALIKGASPCIETSKPDSCPASREIKVKQPVTVSKQMADKLKRKARVVVMKKQMELKHTETLVQDITEKVIERINDKFLGTTFNAHQKKEEISLWREIEYEKKEMSDKASESGKILDVNLMSDAEAASVFITELLNRFAYAKAFDQGSFLVSELVTLVNTVYNTAVPVPAVLPRQWSLPLQLLKIY